MRQDETIAREDLSLKIKVSDATIKRELSFLQDNNVVKRKGGRKDGRWVIRNKISLHKKSI